jgi:6-phosphogluconolactonase
VNRITVSNFVKFFLALAMLLPAFGLFGSAPANAEGNAGVVYVLTNQTAGNSVAVYDRAPDGTLTAAGVVSTGGLGTGSGLGSQGALALSRNNQRLFAVNAGSNDISVFSVDPEGLTLVDRTASGGVRPISLTSHGNLLYVLNAGGSGNITGFTIGQDGALSSIPGSTQPLSGSATNPAQVSFTPDGTKLVVTEKATNIISTYPVGSDGVAGARYGYPAPGITPFGFDFDNKGHLIVSEAFGGAPDASALTSYEFYQDGTLGTVSPSVATHQTAACWTAVSKDGRFAYTTNAGSGSVSGYSIAPNGSLTLLDADGRTGVTGDGSSPIDAAFSNNSRYLYVLTAGSHAVNTFAVGADGSLTSMDFDGGLPAGTVGLVAR